MWINYFFPLAYPLFQRYYESGHAISALLNLEDWFDAEMRLRVVGSLLRNSEVKMSLLKVLNLQKKADLNGLYGKLSY